MDLESWTMSSHSSCVGYGTHQKVVVVVVCIFLSLCFLGFVVFFFTLLPEINFISFCKVKKCGHVLGKPHTSIDPAVFYL